MSSITASPAQHILAIEDDPILGAHLKSALEQDGYHITLTTLGAHGLNLATDTPFHLILLDALLPDYNGFELLTRLRSLRRTPVIMMSALGDEGHRIAGFDCGADDYLPKPFNVKELRVRIEALLRRIRYERTHSEPERIGGLGFDDAACLLTFENHPVPLTGAEYRLLRVLYRHADEVLSKPYLYQQVLHRSHTRHDRSLDMHISNLRRKLGDSGVHQLSIQSVWGQGYVLHRGSN